MQCSENAMLSRGRWRRLLCLHCKQFHISGVESSPFTPISDRQGGQQLYWVILYIKKASSAYIQSLTTTESIITTSLCCSRNKPSGNCNKQYDVQRKITACPLPILDNYYSGQGHTKSQQTPQILLTFSSNVAVETSGLGHIATLQNP